MTKEGNAMFDFSQIDEVKADFGGGFKPMTLYSNPMDDRCGGVWAR